MRREGTVNSVNADQKTVICLIVSKYLNDVICCKVLQMQQMIFKLHVQFSVRL